MKKIAFVLLAFAGCGQDSETVPLSPEQQEILLELAEFDATMAEFETTMAEFVRARESDQRARRNVHITTNEMYYGSLLDDDDPYCDVETRIYSHTDEEAHDISCRGESLSISGSISTIEENSDLTIFIGDPGPIVSDDQLGGDLIRFARIEGNSNAIKDLLEKIKTGQETMAVRTGGITVERPLQKNGRVQAAIEEFLYRTENPPAVVSLIAAAQSEYDDVPLDDVPLEVRQQIVELCRKRQLLTDEEQVLYCAEDEIDEWREIRRYPESAKEIIEDCTRREAHYNELFMIVSCINSDLREIDRDLQAREGIRNILN